MPLYFRYLKKIKVNWISLVFFSSFRQNKLDEALLSSGRVSDAVQSLHEWLQKAEAYLSEDQPILGDLDTVTILCEQHKVMYLNLDTKTPSHEAKTTPKVKAILVSNKFSTIFAIKNVQFRKKYDKR